jgi:fermentation-respiration switch protein FrsA (DUF1100 family)
LIFSFRGAGDSGGNLDIMGWTCDLKAAINYLWGLADIDKSRLSLLGFSAGAAVSVYVASQDERVSCVAACACPAEFTLFTEDNEPHSLINHFRGIGAIREDGFPPSAEDWIDGFRRVSPINHIRRIAPRPLLLIHGSQDETVPVSHSHRLYDTAGETKQLVIIDGAGHRLRQDDRVISNVLDWLKLRCRDIGS